MNEKIFGFYKTFNLHKKSQDDFVNFSRSLITMLLQYYETKKKIRYNNYPENFASNFPTAVVQ